MLAQRSIGERDRSRVLAFVRHEPARHRHVIDLPYRLCSPSAQIADNTSLWETAEGAIAGFALIQRQFWSIDYGTDAGHPHLFETILDWAGHRMQAIASAEQGEYPDGIMNFVDCFDDDVERQQDLIAAGYGDYPAWTQVHRWQVLDREPAEIPPLEGFILRQLAGVAEAAACAELQRAAFGSTNMTPAWRTRVLQADGYVPDLDLVLTGPAGELVAFCLGWQADDQGQIEPIGVHPAFQGQGLGRTLMRACLRRMRARGVSVAHIEHDGANDAAAALYSGEGFSHPRLVRKYMRRWHASNATTVSSSPS